MTRFAVPALLVVAAAALVGCGGGDDDRERGDLPVLYLRQYGGVVGGTSTLKAERDGRAYVHTLPGAQGCGRGKRSFRLTSAEVDRLRRLLAPLPRIKPRTAIQAGVEGDPTIRIQSGGIGLRYTGLDVEPPAVRPLVTELERLVRNHCRRR